MLNDNAAKIGAGMMIMKLSQHYFSSKSFTLQNKPKSLLPSSFQKQYLYYHFSSKYVASVSDNKKFHLIHYIIHSQINNTKMTKQK